MPPLNRWECDSAHTFQPILRAARSTSAIISPIFKTTNPLLPMLSAAPPAKARTRCLIRLRALHPWGMLLLLRMLLISACERDGGGWIGLSQNVRVTRRKRLVAEPSDRTVTASAVAAGDQDDRLSVWGRGFA